MTTKDDGIQLQYGCRASGKTNTYLALWFQNKGRKEFSLPIAARIMGTTAQAPAFDEVGTYLLSVGNGSPNTNPACTSASVYPRKG